MRFLYGNPIPNPCKKDCPGRKAGCSVGCEAWFEYVAKRNEYYKNHIKEVGAQERTKASKDRTKTAILNTKHPKNRR